MLTYKAMYKYLDEGVHAEVLDFPGVIPGVLTWSRPAGRWLAPWWTWQKPTYSPLVLV